MQNPEILRQLTALQQQMSQHQLRQQQLDIEEKMRKLKEMKQQEEEFDKHLAQTVPVSIAKSPCFYNLIFLIIFLYRILGYSIRN